MLSSCFNNINSFLSPTLDVRWLCHSALLSSVPLRLHVVMMLTCLNCLVYELEIVISELVSPASRSRLTLSAEYRNCSAFTQESVKVGR